MMKVFALTLLGLLANAATAIELTADNYDFESEGKTVLIKFFAPWCAHCKKMKPDWDKLMAEFEDSKTQLVAEVDCTSDGGKPLCEANNIRGYPTLKWGDPAELEDYSGGRDLETLKTFAQENLKPLCSPTHMELCDKDHQTEIKKYLGMGAKKLQKQIDAKQKEVSKVEADFKKQTEQLQKQYKDATAKKDEKIAKIKRDGLSLMEKCMISLKKKVHDEL
ncbi:disulfide-isomerase-like protein EhSep2 [Seminavis robusta]|uniref:Disulfide-isomerase-like protein EhSep2 n=1 Tax=Seminavis robusta TaxID=568900 RepID=A0A9N8E0Z1_9STRA|nr:disulfide-isomerase-like protein EhSep2 [Seminavis robusta]|eukprot:Sro427_g140580.1 disulfide-isomerase-like protein EhSep2 (221) ;mRNA; f:7767-8633